MGIKISIILTILQLPHILDVQIGLPVFIDTADDFDLNKIADSGQCFRWEENEQGTFRIIAGGECLYITDLGKGRFELDCTEEEYGNFWYSYFDLGENYRAVRARIDPLADPFLYRAAEEWKGIRILRQDSWEMLVTSIITQNRNIPAIRRSVALLAASCGERKEDRQGRTYFSFPKPEGILSLTEEELKACRLGYRCPYVHAAAEAVCNREIDLDTLKDADEQSTLDALTRLFGVGVKVASCVSLFGLHHLDAFPVDVWVKRILENEYPDGYPYEQYAPYNGIYQQYMFAYYRNRE